jgi:hypothetical protein
VNFGWIFNSIYEYWSPHYDFVMTTSLAQFKTYLNGAANPQIRMWVDATPSRGHQASTAWILRQLADPVHGFGYTGHIEVYYDPNNDNLTKLYKALPELKGQSDGRIDGARVTLHSLRIGEKPPVQQVNLGFTGGSDQKTMISPNLALRVNTKFFLRLQPYMWENPEEIQFADTTRAFIKLTDMAAMGKASFQQRAYYIPTPIPPPNWGIYDGDDRLSADILQYLTTGNAPIRIAPVYSIRTNKDLQLVAPASDRMFEAITAILASQRKLDGTPSMNAASVAALCCDAFTLPAQRTEVRNLLNGGLSSQERDFDTYLKNDRDAKGNPLAPAYKRDLQNALQCAAARRGWLESINASDRVSILWEPTLARVQEAADWLRQGTDRVLLIQLGIIPPPLFHWALDRAGFPTVFEGQSTATVALNIANPYFHVNRFDDRATQYPTTILSYRWHYEPTGYLGRVTIAPNTPIRIQAAANQLNVPLWKWNQVAANNPAEIAGGLVREYYAEGDQGSMHQYYARVRAFYRNVNNDKLRLAVAFLYYILRGAQLAEAARAARAAPPLETLLAALEANTSGGTLRVAPGAFSAGGIFDFYTGLLGAQTGLMLTGSALATEYENGALVKITATGSIGWDDVRLTATIEFTAPDGIVVAQARYSYDGHWALTQIPWIGFSSPFIEIYTADEGAPPAGQVGGIVDGLDIELSFRLPVADGRWQLVGTFEPPYPGIARFYQLAGGVDLVHSLPPPLNGLSGFGLSYVQLVYDLDSGAVENVAFQLTTAESFTLIGNVRVEHITALVVVQEPADLEQRRTDWNVTATFALGSGEDPAVIALGASGPGLTLTGALASGVLRISDIVNAFAPQVRLELPGEPEISGFQCSFTPATGEYEVSCDLNLNWPVYAGDTQIFAIDGVGFAASRIASVVVGSVRGYITIGSGEDAVPLELSASYNSVTGWIFAVAQSPDSAVNLTALARQFLPADWQIEQDYGIAGLELTVVSGAGAWEFAGRTDEDWQIPFIPDLSVAASLRLGYGDVAERDGRLSAAGWHGRLETTWKWNQIEVLFFFDYDPAVQRYGIVWNKLQAILEGPGEQGDWTATLTFTDDTTLGGIVETMVSWATRSEFALEAPWSVLNAIPLSGLSLTYTFNRADPARNTVAFNVDVGPIELGFARIDSVSVTYNSRAQRRVAITLEGSFVWNTGDGAVGDTGRLGPWDASEPGAAPSPPGTGGKYLDLRLLALGQHVAVAGLPTAGSVRQAIELMAALRPPEPGRVPEVGFDPESGWIIGTDLGILRFGDDAPDGQQGYVVTAQVIFNDPRLYGLRLALAGDAAKVFKNLDFQILYRQVSDTLGVYEAEITLPDSMRRLSIGVYTVTLPVFAVAVYTNGDFQVDAGFPWNGDFSRSFTIEGIIAPGIPVTGSAGFYFGKLSSASTELVPKATNGSFNPVLVFGIGMQAGFGKSVEYGVLKAGFSLTAVGILEGVLAAFNPYQPALTNTALTNTALTYTGQLQESYYFRLRGTFGIAGRLYGSVDFSVVKAEVNVSLSVMVELVYESYASLSISVVLAVDVAVSISIEFGAFAIKISFSFSMRLKETFTLDNPGGNPPWVTAGRSARQLLSGPADLRLRHLRAPSLGLATAAADPARWQRLQPSPGGFKRLTGWVVPAITLAHDENDTTADPGRQVGCLVFLAMIESVPETEGTLEEVLERTAAATVDTSFEMLAKMVLRWVVAAGAGQDLTPEQVDSLVVSEADLRFLLDVMLVSTDAEQTPITTGDIDTFMNRQFRFTLNQIGSQQPSATPFAMPPAIVLTAPRYGSYPGYQYSFAAYNALNETAVAALRRYFDLLAVQVEKTSGTAAGEHRTAAEQSMAQWVQSDYYLLIARQVVQAALDSLRDFKYPIDGGSTAQMIADEVNATGQLTGNDQVTAAGILTVNRNHPLQPGGGLMVGTRIRVGTGESFESIAESFGPAISATSLALANALDPVLRAGAIITYRGTAYPVLPNEGLILLARRLDVRLTELLSGASSLLGDTGLLLTGANLLVPLVTAQATADSTFASIAALPAYGARFDGPDLVRANAGSPVLRIGEQIPYPGQDPYQVKANDTLADVAKHFGVSVSQLATAAGVVDRPRLLADLAVLTLPVFTFPTAPGDTLASLASRFATTIEALALPPANASIPGLFAVRGPTGELIPWLDIPHLPKYRVAAILDEMQRTLALRHLSRMTARYAMHGTRLPTTGITPRYRGMWATPGIALPPLAGLYALTGQQIDVPAVTAQNGKFEVTMRGANPPVWLAVGTGQLSFPIEPDSDDANRLAMIVALGTSAPFDIGLSCLGADPMYERRPATYPLTGALAWQSAAPVALPYGPPPDPARVQALRIWPLPPALTGLPDRESAPRFGLRTAVYDEATGGTQATPVRSYAWASLVRFTVKRVPALTRSPATATSYEIAGADGAGTVLLERIVDAIGADDAAFSRLFVGYSPDAITTAPTGVQTDPPASVTLGIAQVNLSSQTRPGRAEPATPEPATAQAPFAVPGLLNTPPAFARLLWEASITRGGGYYLYYYDTDGHRGLPGRIFNDRGEAQLFLLILYARPSAEHERDRVRDYMNAAVTGDSADVGRSVVFAEAAPMEPAIRWYPDLTLTEVARRGFCDIVDLAEANRTRRLATGVRISVTGAVYQAPPGGMPLERIVADYGLTGIGALNAANPRWQPGGLPNPLPALTAICLPAMTLTTGTSPHTAALDDIAAYYGVAVASLAVANAQVPGIFDATELYTVPGGPYVRTATVPPGATAVAARRDKPADVPSRPVGDYARLFLLNAFSLLGYRIARNVYFNVSGIGLPAGPTPPPADTDPSPDKVRVAPDSDVWEYRQSFGYPRYAIESAQRPVALPPADGDPYRGLGSILQVAFSWQDYYGNTLVTTLDRPRQGLLNTPPMLTGYTDPLMALSQWPSVASSWQVAGTAGQPRLEVNLAFDPSRYQGLIKATATSVRSILAAFTDDLDRASAQQPANYQLTGGVGVVGASLGTDQRTVVLTVDPALSATGYDLSVSDVLTAGDGPQRRSYSGSATFQYPEMQDRHSSTVTEAAARDLAGYASLYYQLSDSNGVVAAVTTSLLNRPEVLDSTQWSVLLGWLFTNPAAIYGYLADRAAARTAVTPPPDHVITFPLPASNLNASQIYQLSVAFTLRRSGGAVLPALETTVGIRSATTVIAPRSAPLDPAKPTDTLGLTQFARDFEAALSVPGQYTLKVAGGIDRAAPPSERGTATLWAVRLGTGSGPGIAYRIANPAEPDLFAPRPLSNELQSRLGVPIFDYFTGRGIAPNWTRRLEFTDIDMDVWGRALLAAVDETLTPEFVAAMRIVTARLNTRDYLQEILGQKELLATAVSKWMIALYAGGPADTAAVQDVFRQHLLARLSAAYDVSAGIQFAADVTAQDTTAPWPPRLTGAIVDRKAEGESRSEITLSSPKLDLLPAQRVPFPFLLTAPETVDADGAVVGSIDLDLTWSADSIEHQIARPQGIPDYLASSWLSFILPADLGKPLGSFPVPLVLRSFPASPAMTGQTGQPEHPDSGDLADLKKWTYGFTWSLPFHYVQDRVQALVEFNLSPDRATAATADSFPALAQFVTVYPQVRADLEGILARIDATTADEVTLRNAAIALEAMIDLLGRVTAVARGQDGLFVGPSAVGPSGQAALSYAFEIIESAVQLPDPASPGATVSALLVTIAGAPPAGIGTPGVLVDPDRYDPVRHGSVNFSYYYVDRDTGEYLSQADGQKIAARTVTLPGLDILQRQDAWASVRVTRNRQILEDRPPIADPFVYTTPRVRFADPLLPTVDSSTPVDIARVGPGGPSRPLRTHLGALFDALLAGLPTTVDRMTIQLEAVYSYRINPALDPVELPIFLQPPLEAILSGSHPGITLSQMLTNWADALTWWFGSPPPSSQDGLFHFDLLIMTNLTAAPKPLLRLRELRLSLSDIVPPLAGSAATG